MVEHVKVFLSYSHLDKELMQLFVKQLYTLIRTENIDLWTDEKIIASEDWKQVITNSLDTADLVILLVSANFIQSEYCYSIELQQALKRREARKAVIIPVLLGICSLTDTPIEQIQSLPTHPRFVEQWSNANEALVDVIDGIRKTLRTTVKQLKQWDPVTRKQDILNLLKLPEKLEEACNATIDLAVDFADEFFVFRAITIRTKLSEIEQQQNNKPFGEILNVKQNLRLEIFQLIQDILTQLKNAI